MVLLPFPLIEGRANGTWNHYYPHILQIISLLYFPFFRMISQHKLYDQFIVITNPKLWVTKEIQVSTFFQKQKTSTMRRYWKIEEKVIYLEVRKNLISKIKKSKNKQDWNLDIDFFFSAIFFKPYASKGAVQLLTDTILF